MKNVNMKKIVAGVAALGVASLFAGAVVASNVGSTNGFTAPTKDDIFTAGMPNYTIVVGTVGEPRDVVSAAGIAAAIGSKAYTSTTVNATGATAGSLSEVEVEARYIPSSTGLTVGEGDGELVDNIDISQAATTLTQINLDDSDYSILHDDDYTVKYRGCDDPTTDEIGITEELTVDGHTLFSDNQDVENLITLIGSGEIKYTLTFEDGGLVYADSSDNTYYGTGSSMTIPFMGKTYKIQEINSAGTKITLVEQGSTSLYDEGSTVQVTGEDDEIYTLGIDLVYEDSQQNEVAVKISLQKDGEILDQDGFFSGDKIEFDDYPFEESISVIDLFLTTVSGQKSGVKLSVGSAGQLVLKDNESLPGYPEDDWLVSIDNTGNVGTQDTIVEITVENDDLAWDAQDLEEDDAGLIPGDEITLPLNLGKVAFVGPTEESTYEFVVGNNKVSWVDDAGKNHNVPLYIENIDGKTKKVDGDVDYYFDYNVADDKVYIYDNSDDTTADFTTAAGVSTAWTLATLDGEDGLPIDFAVRYSGGRLDLALYGNGTVSVYDLGKGTPATWTFLGTETGTLNLADLETGTTMVPEFDKLLPTDEGQETAVFRIQDGPNFTGTYIYFFVDPYTGDLVLEDDYTAPNYIAQAVYNDVADGNVSTNYWELDQEDPDTDMEMGYTNYGTILKVDGSKGYAIVPKDQLKLQIFVGGAISPEEQEAITKMFTLTNKGALVSDPTTGLGAKLVDFEVTAGTPGTCTAVSPVSFSATNLVKLDTAAPAGKKIIVGGQNANNLAKIQYGLEDLLTQSGNYVMGKATNGDIVVAGYNWEDTQAAAEDLIDIIEGFQ